LAPTVLLTLFLFEGFMESLPHSPDNNQQTCVLNDTDEECTAGKNLEVISNNVALQGWSTIFQQEDDRQ
jgi:hypothetical protein